MGRELFILVMKWYSFLHFCVIITWTSFFEVSQEYSLVFFSLMSACVHNNMEKLNSKTYLPSCKSGSLNGSHILCYQMEDITPTMTASAKSDRERCSDFS